MERNKPFKHLYGSQWQKIRAMVLRAQPLCVTCEAEGQLTVATVVDHIQDHKGDTALFYDRENLQSLCKRHHDIKTAQTAGGFGHKPGKARARKDCGLDGIPVDANHHWNR